MAMALMIATPSVTSDTFASVSGSISVSAEGGATGSGIALMGRRMGCPSRGVCAGAHIAASGAVVYASAPTHRPRGNKVRHPLPRSVRKTYRSDHEPDPQERTGRGRHRAQHASRRDHHLL